jgi:hypothetical protein
VTRIEVEHAIRAACDVADDPEVWVSGSQSILGQSPDASGTRAIPPPADADRGAPEALHRSAKADIAPRNHPERVDRIDARSVSFRNSTRPTASTSARSRNGYERLADWSPSLAGTIDR